MPSPLPAQRRSVPAPAACALALGVMLFAGNGAALAQKGPSTQSPAPAESPTETPVLVDENAISFAEGLQPMIERLHAQEDLSDADRFTLAGAQFLRGVELALQTRYRLGVTDGLDLLPVLRLELPTNPAPEPFSGAFIETIFADLDSQMVAARETLGRIDDGAEFTATIDLSSVWMDANADGVRQDAEQLLAIGAVAIGGRGALAGVNDSPGALVIDFDQSDAAWLAAYTHLLSTTSDMVLAFAPAATIDEVLGAGAQLDAWSRRNNPGFTGDDALWVDLAATVIRVLEQQPDAERTQSARLHMLAMVEENRTFWQRVGAETDQTREWIPNDGQTSGLGIDFPGGTGPAWLAVLDDLEALLEGELLAPHWRLGTRGGTHGINIRTMLDAPQSYNLLGIIQGAGILYAVEEGTLISDANWRSFETLVGRGRGFFPFLLN
ncbi:MAG: hypothetical protein JJ908_15730 [Rhizobiales bacterium]|nr:hypothetical protein [Hyphomicrobiales bacterium]MBO6700014.1 hypothetical protein [Hyphomicrobiales bacterium]MBO6737821.1 hypothetical protein [Hyphomicrobiales bacterium]MBO6913122.1 hypothetical protein [Hyphomicrobiales bacterium]MBO6954166.1 hypothetical protein [Hyphomicrobiales bacterium]